MESGKTKPTSKNNAIPTINAAASIAHCTCFDQIFESTCLQFELHHHHQQVISQVWHLNRISVQMAERTAHPFLNRLHNFSQWYT